jgi:hypothetical protein
MRKLKNNINLETINSVVEATYPDVLIAFYLQLYLFIMDDGVGVVNTLLSGLFGFAY